MSFTQTLKTKVIEPHDRQRFDLITGQVMSYDEETHTATVCYRDAKTGGLMTQERVPLELTGLGVIASGPFPGDQVYLSFMNGNQLKPKVVATADESYATYTRPLTKHGRKGAFLTDYLSSVTSFIGGLFSSDEEGDKAVQEDWIDDTSSPVTYQSYRQYSTDEFTTKGENWSYYRTSEVGFTHPLNSSTLKIRDNGVVESFASTNCGWRIDPNTHSMNFVSTRELHNATSTTFLVDKQLRLEAGRELYTQTPSVKTIADKQQYQSDSIIINTERYRLTGEDTRITTDKLKVTSEKSELSLGETSLKASILEAISTEMNLSADNVTLGASDVSMNTENLTIVGHIEANIDHLIERWMNQHFGGYFDRALGERQVVKLMDK